MNELIQLDLPAFESLDDDALTSYAADQLREVEAEARQAQQLSETAFEKAWAVGKACVTLKERIGPEKWQAFAIEHIHQDYMPIYRCMRLARINPAAPPLRGSLRYKQLMIALGEEDAPKPTPRKTDHHSFVNFKAANMALKRWWRDGEVIKSVDKETLQSIKEDVEWMSGFIEALDEAIEA